jgi:hypothetical protein
MTGLVLAASMRNETLREPRVRLDAAQQRVA